MNQVNVAYARAHLSDLIARARRGEEVVIAKRDEPMVRLVPVENHPKRKPQFGAMKGRARVDDAFFEPLSPEELEAWDQ